MQSRETCPCGGRPRAANVIGAELAELLVRVRAELPALRRTDLPPPEEPGARECVIMNRWMAGSGIAYDVRTTLWPLTLELQHGLCACCAAREAARRRRIEDAPATAVGIAAAAVEVSP